MNIRIIIKTVIAFLVVFALGVILHINVFGRMPLGVVTPNVLLIITVAFGYMRGSVMGMIMGFFCGLMIDCYDAGIFGINCLLYLLIGYANGFFAKYFYGDDIKMPMLLVFVSDIIYGSVIYLFAFLYRGRYGMGFYYGNIIFPEAVYSLIISMILYSPLLKVVRWISPKESRERRFG